MPIELDDEAAGHLLQYLIYHEVEIAKNIEGYGELRLVFFAILKREPDPKP